jgi:ribosome-binding protein aMBF1 (putative translation factor)
MALRKMTFTIPDEIAEPLLKRVPARQRSGYVAEAIADKLKQRDEQLIRACEAANQDPDVTAIEREMDMLTDKITEPWIDTAPR